MKKFNVSLLVKTFLRPMCLDNLLSSVQDYQSQWDLEFDEILIIDDSDDENQRANQEVLKKYPNLKTVYKSYPFNSVGLSKGRNEGLKFIKNDWFILCDDDFIFDTACDLGACLDLAIRKKVDILGGHYRDIQSLGATTYTPGNWMGFIRENDEFDYVSIFNKLFPKFCYCDIVQNFYIGRTEAFKKVSYPEDMPLLEHNVFFLRAKHAGLTVATTSDLWVKHFHIRSNANYNNLRDRKVVNPITKPVLGYLHTSDRVIHFHDYLHIKGDEIYRRVNPPRTRLQNFWAKIIKKG